MDERVYDFFKTFSDANRIRIAALLIDRPATVEEIAHALQLRIADVTRALAQIEKIGLLTNTAGKYRLEPKALEALSRELLAGHRPAAEARSNDENADDFDRQTVKNYSLPDGRLRELPAQPRKLHAILRHIAQDFAPGKHYSEKEVNIMLARYYPDSPSLRRYLVDNGLLLRTPNGSEYWRAEL